jgi:hypothetical protein
VAYGEYAEALRFTAEAREDGRSGIAGAADDIVVNADIAVDVDVEGEFAGNVGVLDGALLPIPVIGS